MQLEKIDFLMMGEPMEVRAYPHPNGKAVSMSINSAKGCVWRSLVDVQSGIERADPQNDRAMLRVALNAELRRMKFVYAAPALVLGLALGVALSRIFT